MDIDNIASTASEIAGASSSNNNLLTTTAGHIGNGLKSAGDWVQNNPIAGTAAVVGIGALAGYTVYKAFVKSDKE